MVICRDKIVHLSDIETQFERTCADFSSLISKQVAMLRDPNTVKHIRKLVAKAKADGRVLIWTRENSVQRLSEGFGEMSMGSEPRQRHDISGILESCRGENGMVDFTLVKAPSPPAKPKLMYKQLNGENAGHFCDGAGCAVLGNTLMECAKSDSNFSQLELDIPCRLISQEGCCCRSCANFSAIQMLLFVESNKVPDAGGRLASKLIENCETG